MKLLKNNLISSHCVFPAFILVLICGFVFLPGLAKATTETFPPSGLGGSGTWTAPDGVYSVIVDVWAGGGQGGGSSNSSGGAGGGGAGGGFASTTVTVIPGQLYSYYVGRTVFSGTATSNGSAGQDSMFQASSTVLAKGGGGGLVGPDGAGGATTTGAFGYVIYHGGNGAAGVSGGNGGGGGGGAGSAGNGTAAVGITKGNGGTPDGGNGGNGNNNDGSLQGGGGGGGKYSSIGQTGTYGGYGSRGKIRLTYTVVTAPTLTTDLPTSAATSTMTLNANISATGGADVSQSGFAYGTVSDLSTTIATSTLGAQTGTASFSQNLSGLTPGIEYFFRAYATNSAGTGYGSITSTSTIAVVVPTVSASVASSILTTAAILNGSIDNIGGDMVTDRGFEWGVSASYGTTITTSDSYGTGSFTSNLTGLTCNTSYHFRSFATNSAGTGTSADATFTTSACGGGGGLPPGAYSSPALPSGGEFSILIQNGADYINSRTVALKLNGGADAKSMAISNSADFYAAGQEPYQTTKTWTLADNDGLKTIYVRFYTQYGQPSPVVSDAIIFTSPASNPPPADNPPASANPPLIGSQSTITTLEQIQSEVKAIIAGKASDRIADFITNGTPTTKILGSGERAGVINSFKSAFGWSPKTESDWSDCLKIANGRWPSQRSIITETNAANAFKKIYLRSPNRNNSNDDAAVTVISYGLRPPQRNLNSERAAIKSFMSVYGYTPKSVSAWDIVRAIAYSGAKR